MQAPFCYNVMLASCWRHEIIWWRTAIILHLLFKVNVELGLVNLVPLSDLIPPAGQMFWICQMFVDPASWLPIYAVCPALPPVPSFTLPGLGQCSGTRLMAALVPPPTHPPTPAPCPHPVEHSTVVRWSAFSSPVQCRGSSQTYSREFIVHIAYAVQNWYYQYI